MPNWEYKVITSGLHGFATPALLEAHLNALGKEEWEIIHFQTQPNNPLAFNGLARRSTQRDWAPPELPAQAPAAKVVSEPVEPVRPAPAKAAPEPAATVEPARDDKAPLREETLRPFRDTERDQDPDAPEDEDWDKWVEEEDELPTFFEAIKPHMRRNQKGPGMSVALDYLAKRWELREADVVSALLECGFVLPENEDSEPTYLEFEGDLYWANRNNRGQLFLNTREKPRPVFRTVQANKLSPDDPAHAELANERAAEKAETERRNAERAEREAAAKAAAQARAEREAATRAEREAAREAARAAQEAARAAHAAQGGTESAGEGAPAAPAHDGPLQPAPTGDDLLDKIRPFMRRNRRGPGHSGSTSFLARALHVQESDLVAAFAALGLTAPANAGDKPTYVELERGSYWVNKDSRGGLWINARERRAPATPAPAAGTATAAAPTEVAPAASVTTTDGVAPVTASTSEPSAPATPVETPAAPEVAPTDSAPVDAVPEVAESDTDTLAPFAGEATSSGDPVLAAVRILLRANKRGSGFSGELGFLANTLGKTVDELQGALGAAGLRVPADAEEKPVFVEQAGEIFWFNRNPNDGSLWVNAKAAKAGRRPAKPRTRKPKAEAESDADTSA